MIKKYITSFDNESDYDSFVESSAFTYPNVSLVDEHNTVKFNPVEYAWTVSGTTCEGYDKYELEVKQWKHKGGTVWHTVYPEELRLGQLIEHDSEDCGYQLEP